MAVGDIYEVQLSFQTGSVPVLCVPHFRETVVFSGPAGMPASAGLALGIHGSPWLDALMECVSVQMELLSIFARRISPTPGAPYLRIVGSTVPWKGARNMAAESPQVALLFSLYSDDLFGSHGRLYLPGVAHEDVIEGKATAGTLARMQTVCDRYLDDISSGGAGATGEWEHIIWHRAPATYSDVDFAIPRSNTATIRGRRARPGLGG